jgi:outer membrane protein assembly factor BamB
MVRPRLPRIVPCLAAAVLSLAVLSPTQIASATPAPSSAGWWGPGCASEWPRPNGNQGQWPSPNSDLCNTRVGSSSISSADVSTLGVGWTLPLTGDGGSGFDVANPVVADGVAYLQDGASNVTAVQVATGHVLWTHSYDSPDYGPNGVTVGNGRIYGVTATGVFGLDARTGRQLWYNTRILTGSGTFDIAPQEAGGRVFVASALAVGGGQVYALDARTGALDWSFQTVIDKIGLSLPVPTGGAWDPVLIGPDHSLYVGTGNPYLSAEEAQATPSRELYTDSIVKLDQTTGRLEWYYQAFPDDFHDWDLQVSPIFTVADGRPVVLAAGKSGYVYAFDPVDNRLLWKTAVGIHNGHDNDDQLALRGKLNLQFPYSLEPGEAGGVETDMAAADGVVYVPVDDLPTAYTSATQVLGTANFGQATGEMVALSLATGKPLWSTDLPQLPLGGATVTNDLVFTTTLTGQVVALARQTGAIVWTAQLPAGSNSTPAIVGKTLIAGAGVAASTGNPMVVAYQLGAQEPAP